GVLDSGFVRRVGRLKTRFSSLKFHCSLIALPDFSRHLGHHFEPKMLAMIKICPSVEYFESNWEDARQGRPTRNPLMYVQIPSVYDDSLAPLGHHVMSCWMQLQPVRLASESWDDVKEEVAENLISTLETYAPNIREIISNWELFTPLDLERRPGMTDGNIRHLDTIPQQLFSRRTLPGCEPYKTPIRDLYLCGAGTHPGGEVTGAPGHNAAQAILADLNRL
ncbi:MAG: phytoene desaturase family protein, partial [Dehalococcoidia bacterium]